MEGINLYNVTIKGIPPRRLSNAKKHKISYRIAKCVVGRENDDETLLKRAMVELNLANNTFNTWVFHKKEFVQNVSL